MEAKQDRPPFVNFEVRAEEDRTASIEQGHYVAVDVDYALITPAGSRDCVERKVSEWFTYLEEQVKGGRFPQAWLEGFKHKYKHWKETQELPVDGTPIKTWNALSPAQCKMLLDLNVRTVEDLAAGNEELISRMGMGGRQLRERAAAWLATAKDVGRSSEQLAAAVRRAEDAEARIKQLEEAVALLKAQIPAQRARAA